MQVQVRCPYCESLMESPGSAGEVRCRACHRAFWLRGSERVSCPQCGSLLQVPTWPPTLQCGECGRCFVPDKWRRRTATATNEPTEAMEEETSVMASVREYEEEQLEAVRAEFADRYEVIDSLGRGGMGAVYKAVEVETGRPAVLKLLRKGRFASESYRTRFRQEARAVARLKHPGIVSVRDFGELNGQLFLAMEYVEGSDIREYVIEENLGVRQISRLLIKVCEALQHAHGHGVVHRDLKPANILVDHEGNPKLVDFGLARMTERGAEGEESPLGETRAILGTLSYMSPEQTLGYPEAIDERSDLYSLGVVMYQLLTGAMPYPIDCARPGDSMQTIREEPARPPSAVRREVDSDLDAIVLKCLHKQSERRYESARRLADDLERYLRGKPVQARPASGLYHVRRLTSRHQRALLAIAGAFLALLLVLGLFVGRLAAEEQSARAAAALAREDLEIMSNLLVELDAAEAATDRLLARHRYEAAYRLARNIERQAPPPAGIGGFARRTRGRIADQAAHDLREVARLIEELEFGRARSRLRELQSAASALGLEELCHKVAAVQKGFDEDCWAAVMNHIQRGGGTVPALTDFLTACPESPRAGKAHRLLQKKLTAIRFTRWPFDAEEAERRRRATARELGISVRREWTLEGASPVVWMLIPAGEYVMGTSREGEAFAEDQKPAHRVRIREAFYLSASEVTRGQFEAVMGRSPSCGEQGSGLPAAVSWEEARAFCEKLSGRRGAVVRLPTEAQWEYACRAGSENPYGASGSPALLFEAAWCRPGADGRPHPPGEKRSSVWGLHDIYGNMLEWCRDWYDPEYYGSAPTDEPAGPGSGKRKVLRGGSWAAEPARAHAAQRYAASPESCDPTFGFRILLEVGPFSGLGR